MDDLAQWEEWAHQQGLPITVLIDRVRRVEEELENAWGELYLAAQGEGDPLKAIDRIRRVLGR